MRQNLLTILSLIVALVYAQTESQDNISSEPRVCPDAQTLSPDNQCICSTPNTRKAGNSCINEADIDRMFDPTSRENFSP